jgi:hypothetical protein
MSLNRSLLIVVAVLSSAAHAETIYVDDDNCPGPGNGTPENPYCSIQDAIDTAVDTDEIVVAPGTYFETIDFLGKAITLRSSDGPLVTIIDACQNGIAVTCHADEGPATVLDGFTITNGTGQSGGGMLNWHSSPTVTNCSFVGNSGGGLGNYHGSPTVTGCAFVGNSALSGGGMYNYGQSSPTVVDCTFIGNLASRVGGGMYNVESSPTLRNCVFSGNTAGSSDLFRGGGGMYNDESSPTLAGCTFDGNEANFGGGLLNRFHSSPTLVECTFTGNSALRGGGGMHNTGFPSDAMLVTNCSFIGNSAGEGGGGMYNYGIVAKSMNCSFVDNVAVGRGGGVYNWYSNSIVVNCTFGGNTAGQGGAMYNELAATPTLRNCIAWGNVPDEIVDDPNEPPAVSAVSYSDVQGGWPGDGNLDADPLFLDPDNGNLRLSPGSPCIDAGDNTAVPDGIDTDLDGNPRFVDDPDTVDTGYGDPPLVDMGAYEFQACPWDLNGNGYVWIIDLLLLLCSWGPCDGCPADFDGDGVVDVMDLLDLLCHWGPCP